VAIESQGRQPIRGDDESQRTEVMADVSPTQTSSAADQFPLHVAYDGYRHLKKTATSNRSS
jgi:hypothetical protein